MAKYFYEKWSLKDSYIQNNPVYLGDNSSNYAITGGENYTLDSVTGYFTVATFNSVTLEPGESGQIYELASGYRVIMKRWETFYIYNRFEITATKTQIKNALLETLSEENGTYPINGIVGDYWYVKKGLAESAIIVAQNGGETVDSIYYIEWTTSNSSMTYDIDLSLNNGQTWKTLVTGTMGTSFSYDFAREAESSLCLLRIRGKLVTEYTQYDLSNSVFTIRRNIVPNPPTNLYPASVAINREKVSRFSWKHNDTDGQSGFSLQWSTNGTTWNTIAESTINQYVDISAFIFPLGPIIWRVKTIDSGGLISSYSQQQTFTASVASNAATITSSASISVSRPVFTWSQSEQIAFQIQLLNSLGAILWDSGEIASTNKAMTCGVDLVNSATYTLKIRTKNNVSLWTDYSIQNLVVSYTPPAMPALSMQTDNIRGSIQLRIINPTPVGTEPAVSYMDVYRKIKNESNFIRIATNVKGNFTDYTPQNKIIYVYYVKVMAVNNTYSESKFGEGSISIKASILSVTNDFSKFTKLIYNSSKSINYGRKGILSEFAGREYPVMDFEEQKVHEIPLSFVICGEEKLNELMYIIDCGQTLLFRDNRNKYMFCVPSVLQVKDEMANMWSVSFTLTRVSFNEVI